VHSHATELIYCSIAGVRVMVTSFDILSGPAILRPKHVLLLPQKVLAKHDPGLAEPEKDTCTERKTKHSPMRVYMTYT
jgi:hypothetical protein